MTTPGANPGHQAEAGAADDGTSWVEVYVDSAEENMVPKLALRAHSLLDERWNGWARPLATAAAVSDFLRRWRANDPNGVWGEAIELKGQLLCTRSDADDPESFPRAGTTDAGVALYDLSGWTWIETKPATGSGSR